MSADGGPTSDEVWPEFSKLIQQEEQTLWRQGDLIQGMNDSELGRLATKANRTLTTLRERERVSREFPEEMRDEKVSWTCYRILLRIKDADERQEILQSRTRWTIELMTAEVTNRNQQRLPRRSVLDEIKVSGGFLLGDFKVTGNRGPDGTVTLTTPNAVISIEPHDLGSAGAVIVITPA